MSSEAINPMLDLGSIMPDHEQQKAYLKDFIQICSEIAEKQIAPSASEAGATYVSNHNEDGWVVSRILVVESAGKFYKLKFTKRQQANGTVPYHQEYNLIWDSNGRLLNTSEVKTVPQSSLAEDPDPCTVHENEEKIWQTLADDYSRVTVDVLEDLKHEIHRMCDPA
jgi:hypothetical protein